MSSDFYGYGDLDLEATELGYTIAEMKVEREDMRRELAAAIAARTELAEESETYAAEADDMRRQLAAAVAIQTEQAATIAELRAQLHAAGIEPTNRRWLTVAQIGVAA